VPGHKNVHFLREQSE
jgi:hypothetical protein